LTAAVTVARLYVFGGYGPNVDEYLHGDGDFFWDTVSRFVCVFFILVSLYIELFLQILSF